MPFFTSQIICQNQKYGDKVRIMQCFSYRHEDFPGGSDGQESACNTEVLGSIPGLKRSSGEGNGSLSGILALKIPWTEEPGGLQSMGSQRVHVWKKPVPSTEGSIAGSLSSCFPIFSNSSSLSAYVQMPTPMSNSTPEHSSICSYKLYFQASVIILF